MAFKKICVLMLAMSRAGKTTKVATLSNQPEKVAKLCIKSDATTPVTTDWELSLSATDIKLKKVELNPKSIYGSPFSRTIEKYNKNLEENPVLTTLFGLEKIEEDSGIKDPKDYVEKRIAEFVASATFETIECIMNAKEIGYYVKRIAIELPPNEMFAKRLRELDLEVMVLRDTKGMMDVKLTDHEKMENLSMYEIGLDDVDAVLLLCSTEEFPVQAGEWYKRIYSDCFKSVPVFLESRTDALRTSYLSYCDVMDITAEEYLEKIKERKVKSFNEIYDTLFESGFNLLRTYGAAYNYSGRWDFVYKVFDTNNCLFLTSVVPSLKQAARDGRTTAETFNNDSYNFFRDVVIDNICNIARMVKGHLELTDLINNNGIFDKMVSKLMNQSYANDIVHMCPNYRDIPRSDVNHDIIASRDFLGPREGITTQSHGSPRYLAAATSAATAYNALWSIINGFSIEETVKNSNGEEIAPDINLARQAALMRMHMNKKLRSAADIYANFRNYPIVERNITVDAIFNLQKYNMHVTGKDPLTIVATEISRLIFG